MVPFRSYGRTLLWKVLSNFRRNLTIRHLVNCFNAYDASTEVLSFKTFFQFALCLTRTKYRIVYILPSRDVNRSDALKMIRCNVLYDRIRSQTALPGQYEFTFYGLRHSSFKTSGISFSIRWTS